MNRWLLTCVLFLGGMGLMNAQEINELTEDGLFKPTGEIEDAKRDSLSSKHKEIPRGLKVWTIDPRFGDRTMTTPDTLSHLFMNKVFTTGMQGEYNTIGNVGTPRLHRVFTDRPGEGEFIFTEPFDYFIQPVDQFQFTNTYSPITNLSYNTCGNRTNGEDRLQAHFAVNAGRKIGVGFKFDYLYGRGYYQNQSTSLFDYTLYGSYIGDRYQAHFLSSFYHQKQAENGGITNDNYITHPEIFTDSYKENEIPTMLEKNWNRNDHQHLFFTHRYNIGFSRKVPMTEDEIKARKFAIESKKDNEEAKEREKAQKTARESGRSFDENEFDKRRTYEGRPDGAKVVESALADSAATFSQRIAVSGKAMADSLLAEERKMTADTAWMKTEYVPVTSFIHTISFDNYRRLYTAYSTPENYYANDYYAADVVAGDSINDRTRHYQLNNTFAVALLEGFNKWAKAGLKAFLTHTLRHNELPNTTGGRDVYNDQTVSVGGQLSKTKGRTLHYEVTGEFGVAGYNAGEISLEASADLNIPLLGDTLQIEGSASFDRGSPTFFYSHYHSRHFWWDNDDWADITHSRLQGVLSMQKTRTTLRVAIDEIKNYTYFATKYEQNADMLRLNNELFVRQYTSGLTLFTASLSQDFTFGPLNWETVLTYQASSKGEVLPVPALNIYSNLYLRFKMARVLKCDLGADVRYFTSYEAPHYVPGIGRYAVQENADYRTKIGNYPIVNVYANFHLKHTRFFIMLSHVNAGSGNRAYFLAPHYPLNGRVLRFGLSWNFFN